MNLAYDVNLVRFSTDPVAMRGFLEACGLVTVVSRGSSYALLRGASGWATVHAAEDSATRAEPGETQLAFLVPDAAAAAQQLAGAGLEATLHDEAFGRVATLSTPRGRRLWVGEHQDDLYGYTAHEPAEPAQIAVTAVWFSTDFARDRELFAHLGFVTDGHADEFWEALQRSSGSGRIGLHHSDGSDEPRGPNATCDLGLETVEPLEELAARLTGAGFPAEVVRDEWLSAVHVTDPDGRALQVHARG